MTYDRARQRVVLVGGIDSLGYQPQTWEWDGATWQFVTASGPAACLYHGLAYDGARQRTVLALSPALPLQVAPEGRGSLFVLTWKHRAADTTLSPALSRRERALAPAPLILSLHRSTTP